MGIRGAWSLVSSDPRRFGEPWVCCLEESVIWIDGPSLVYYMALQPKFDQVDRFHGRYNQIGQASPACIYKRAENFITVLTQLAKEVHVVMDGLCSASKIPTQVERMKVAAQVAEEAARLSIATRNCKVISVLAEWTIVDAIENLQGHIKTLKLHRLSSGEAEAFIDANMRQHTDKEAVVIMSNDTDYLVYENCSGFLPFSSLQFTPIEEDGRLGLTGFHYLASKFRRAFFPNYLDNQILTTVAALAGCDYDDDTLQAARKIIVKSKLGGLRIKHQNKPTMQSTLTAILRYVGHFVNIDDAWRNNLVGTIGGDIILESLNRVHHTYYQAIRDDSNETIHSLDYHRLIDSGMFFCRPLIERWSSPPIKPASKANRAPTLSKRSRKRKKRKMLEASAAAAEDETLENPDFPLMECIDLDDDWLCLDYEKIQERKCSMWTLPHFKRVRVLVYSLLAKSTIGAGAADYVTEWRRIGNNQSLQYTETRVALPVGAVAPTVEDMIKSCSNANPTDESCQTWDINLTPSLLPPTVRWVWYLLMTIPSKSSHGQCAAKPHESDIANLMCLAYFHSRLAIEVLIESNEKSQPHRVNDHSLEKLDTDMGVWIFNIIQDMDKSDLPEKFFESPQVVGTNFGDEWRNNFFCSMVMQD